jgi:hypothetical protein
MATHQGDESLKHALVKRFGSVDGAAKDVKPTDYSAAAGTTSPKK